MFGEDDIVKSHKFRADIILNIVFICFAFILSRLWYLQIYRGEQFREYSLKNRLRREVIKAPRGLIYSGDNLVLVHNSPRFDAIIIPQYLKNKEESLRKLSKILDLPMESINKILKKSSSQARYMPVTIKKNLSREEVAVIETENSKIPGVRIEEFISREYRDDETGGHLLGYISEISKSQLPKYKKRDNFNYKLGDFIGQDGLEERFDTFLRGRDGYEFVEVDARGRMKSYISKSNILEGIKNKPPVPGHNIRLTIDRDLQKTAYESLKDKVGSAVAVDVQTGEVLAAVSRPSFNPTLFSRGITTEYWSELSNDERNPLLDRTIKEHYAPGSTFKTITAIAALEEGIIDENTEVNCSGAFRLGRRKFHCWRRYGHGKVDVVRSLRESCDVFYYKIATMMDIDTLARYAKALGFGTKSGIPLPREIPGLMPTKEWKLKRNGQPWQKGETLSCVIGQSFVLATPLQLALAYATIANGGALFRPKLVKEIFDNSGNIVKKYDPVTIQKITISEKTLNLVKRGLVEVVNHRKGTARGSRGRGIHMAGKTGTSQVMSFTAEKLFSKCEEKEYEHRHHGVFTAYAPYDDPKIAVAVVIEHGCSGSASAAPVAKNIVTTYMKKYLPEVQAHYAEEERQEYLKRLREMRKKEEKEKEEGANEA